MSVPNHHMDKIPIAKTKTISKGEIIHSCGDIAQYAYRVERGCLKSYVIDNAGKEHILQFAPEGWLIGDMDSSINQRPSKIFIDAIETSQISYIPTYGTMQFDQLDMALRTELFIKVRNKLIATDRRIISLLSSTAEERYIEFTQTYPSLVQRLPLKLIASYIGITPEYLSGLRRTLAKRG